MKTKLQAPAAKAIEAGKREEESCDDISGKPDRYKKAAASRAYGRYLKACDEAGLTTKEAVDVLRKVREA